MLASITLLLTLLAPPAAQEQHEHPEAAPQDAPQEQPPGDHDDDHDGGHDGDHHGDPEEAAEEAAGDTPADPLQPTPEELSEQEELAALAFGDRLAEGWALDAAVEVICGVLFQRRPWLARELGRGSHDGALGPFDALERSSWENALSGARTELARVRGAQLPPERLPDLLWLRALLDAEALAREALPSGREDPGLYVRHAAGGLGAMLQAPGLSIEERAASARRWLAGLPALTAAAHRNLRETVAPWTEIALEDLADLEQLTAVVVAALVRAPSLTEEQREAGEAALELGLGALRDYQTYLTERILPVGRPAFAMNAKIWRGTLRRLTGAEIELDALQLQLLRDLGRLDRILGGAGRARGTRRTSDVPAYVLFTQAVRSLPPLAVKVGLAVPPGRAFIAVPSATGHGYLPIADWRPGALAPGVLVLGMPSPLWPGALSRAREAEFSRPALFALAVRYGPLGEWALRARNANSLLPGRVALENFPLREGFGLYATDWALRLPSISVVVNDRTRHELHRQRFGAALRLYAALLLHGRGEPFEVVVETWVLHTGDDLETARRAVTLVSRDPFAGAGYISYLELLRVERALGGEGPEGLDVLRTLHLVAENPCGRPADLLEHLELVAPDLAPGHSSR